MQSISSYVHVISVEIDLATTAKRQDDSDRRQSGIALSILPSPYRSLIRLLLDYIDAVDVAVSNTL